MHFLPLLHLLFSRLSVHSNYELTSVAESSVSSDRYFWVYSMVLCPVSDGIPYQRWSLEECGEVDECYSLFFLPENTKCMIINELYTDITIIVIITMVVTHYLYRNNWGACTHHKHVCTTLVMPKHKPHYRQSNSVVNILISRSPSKYAWFRIKSPPQITLVS